MKKLDFGDYCQIEMLRHFSDNEFFVHKVIGRINSNEAVDVPIAYGNSHSGHAYINYGEVVPCLDVVCCGVVEDKIFRVRECDVKARIDSDFRPEAKNLEMEEALGLLLQAKNSINHARKWITNLSVKYSFEFYDDGTYKLVSNRIKDFLNDH